MYLSELPGKHHGCRAAAIAGHKEIGRRARELGADTAVVFDVHWLVNSAYHVNSGEHFKGVYTSNELPHFIKNMEYEYAGAPELGELIAAEANAVDVRTLAHNIPSLELEYGTLVPMRYMHMDVPKRRNSTSCPLPPGAPGIACKTASPSAPRCAGPSKKRSQGAGAGVRFAVPPFLR